MMEFNQIFKYFRCDKIDQSINPCRFYIKGGFCSGEYFLCKEFLIRKMKLHQSQLKQFSRCPFRFYVSEILGYVPKPEYQPLALRRGDYFHSLISSKPKIIPFWEDEEREKIAVEEIYKVIKELDMIPQDVEFEITFSKDGAEGILDIVGNDFFGELKFTERPDFYLNHKVAHFQLGYYFYLSRLPVAYMLPVRVPSLKLKPDESLEVFRDRLSLDIRRRLNHYFPEYNPEKRPFKWGRKFYISEFDLEEIGKHIDYTLFMIKFSLLTDNFPKNISGCMFPSNCEFQPVCETNYINENIYTKREVSI